MRKFMKRPVVIEAVEWDGTESGASLIIDWVAAHGGDAYYDQWDCRIFIKTLEEWIAASPGDWIVRGVQSEFYPVKPDIFEQTYEELA